MSAAAYTVPPATSDASAQALLIPSTGASSNVAGAYNDGTSEFVFGAPNPPLSSLGTQSVFTSGVLGQIARAPLGQSGACAGLLGAGGNFGTQCTPTPGAGLVLNLGTAGDATISLRADAIVSTCTSTGGTASASTVFANASIVSTTGGVDTTLLTLPTYPAADTGLEVPGVVSLTLNQQDSSGPGSITDTGLLVTPEADTITDLQAAQAVCDSTAAPVPTQLTVTASSARVLYGSGPVTITPSYSGFVDGDDSSVVSGVTCSAPVDATTPPGTYASTCSGGSASGYYLSYVAGTVTVTAPSGQGIVTVRPRITTEGRTAQTFTFTFTAPRTSSGLLNGRIIVAAPSGWPAVSVRPLAPGYVTTTCGTASAHEGVTIDAVTLAPGASCTITYGDRSGGGPGVTVPMVVASVAFPFSERSIAAGTAHPVRNVKPIVVQAPTG